MMEEKNQTNQNPEAIQEEKSKVAETAAESTKTQIADDEKENIKSLLKDEKEEPKKEESTETQEVTHQISETEEDEIRSLLSFKFGQHIPTEDEIDFEQLNKQELVELLEEIVVEKDISKIKKQVALIKSHFISLNKEEINSKLQDFISQGGNADDFKHNEDPLEKRFNMAFGIYRFNKAKYSEIIEKEKQENLQLKLNILEELKELINSEETLKKTYDEFRVLQDKWKEIGMVPASELSELWRNYHFLVEKFFDKVRINKELRDLDLRKNMEAKIKLCEKAEELLLEESVLKSFKLLQKYHDEYREIGPVPSDKKDEIWERFKAASDKINQKRKEYYSEIQKMQEENYKAKLALIEQAKEYGDLELNSIKEWNSKTTSINELVKTWKTIGRVPKAHNDEVWNTFRSHLNNFFEKKRVYFAEIKEQQTNNYNLKLELCAEAESIKDSQEWKKTTDKLIKLQKRWKEIGPVPRRHSDKIWKRFRAACDEFFEAKSNYYKGRHENEKSNLEIKLNIIKEIKEFKPGDDKKTNIDKLKQLQRKWVETGHVPFDKKEKLQSDYRNAVNALLDKLNIKKNELSAEEFKERVEMIKNAPDSDRVISRERANLRNRINKLKEDVSLWENNLSFFTFSSKSNSVKDDFTRKIENARKEIELIKEKLKLLK